MAPNKSNKKTSPNQSQLNAMSEQLKGAQASVNQIAASRGVSLQKNTSGGGYTAVPINRGGNTSQLADLQRQLQSKQTELASRQQQNTPTPAPVKQAPQFNQQQYTPQTSGADAYYKQLLESMKPTSEETNLQGQNTALEGQLRGFDRSLDQRTVDTEGQPIARGFIQGQSAAIAKQGAIDRGGITDKQQTLQSQLANLQQRRQASIDVAKVGVDYGTAKDREFNEANRFNIGQATSASQYQDTQKQQQFSNTFAEQGRQDALAQQIVSNRIAQQNANTSAVNAGKANTKEEDAFQADINTGITQLRSGSTWAQIWNNLYNRYKTGNETKDAQLRKALDDSLGKDQWSKAGAFQDFRRSIPSSSGELVNPFAPGQ